MIESDVKELVFYFRISIKYCVLLSSFSYKDIIARLYLSLPISSGFEKETQFWRKYKVKVDG